MINNFHRAPRRGDIFWITTNPFRPTIGSVQQPNRPGVIVSNDSINSSSRTYEIVYLTTAPKKDMPEYCTINVKDKTSTVLCEQIQTVGIEQLDEYHGSVTQEEMGRIEECMALSLGISERRDEAPVIPNYDESDRIKELQIQLENEKQAVKFLKDMYSELLNRWTSQSRSIWNYSGPLK